MSFFSGWQKGRIGREGTIDEWDGVVTSEDVSDGAAEAAGGELEGEADAANEVVVAFGFVGATEVDVEETAAGTATFTGVEVEVEVEVATEAVARVVVEAESAVLEV